MEKARESEKGTFLYDRTPQSRLKTGRKKKRCFEVQDVISGSQTPHPTMAGNGGSILEIRNDIVLTPRESREHSASCLSMRTQEAVVTMDPQFSPETTDVLGRITGH